MSSFDFSVTWHVFQDSFQPPESFLAFKVGVAQDGDRAEVFHVVH
jgi:hypothetical protein